MPANMSPPPWSRRAPPSSASATAAAPSSNPTASPARNSPSSSSTKTPAADSTRCSPAQPPVGSRPAPGQAITFHPEPHRLKDLPADILVLAAIPGSVQAEDAARLRVRIVCELAGVAVTTDAKRILHQRQIQVIPDNLASSGGLLVSLYEMLQNSAGQNWDRRSRNPISTSSSPAATATVLQAGRPIPGRRRPPPRTSLALKRMRDRAIYRERLEAAAAQLQERLLAVREHGTGAHRVAMTTRTESPRRPSCTRLIESLHPRRPRRMVLPQRVLPLAASSPNYMDKRRRREPREPRLRAGPGVSVRGPGQDHVAPWPTGVRSPSRFTSYPPGVGCTPAAAGADATSRASSSPSELDVLLISPQTSEGHHPYRHFPTAMILKELAAPVPGRRFARPRSASTGRPPSAVA